jgi:glycine/D-amino acid oxidase-like deaminating enzyme
MEDTEVIIVGQGLAGTWLSWWLFRAGIRFRVIDHRDPNGASLRAAGLINPVTGRRMVTTWMIDELMPFATRAYSEIGEFLHGNFMEETSVIDFFPTVQMLQAFGKRFEEDPTWLGPGMEREKYAEWFRYDLGWGAIQPCQLVNVERLLTAWRNWLASNDLLIEEGFDMSKLKLEREGIRYSGAQYRYIFFCDGKASSVNPFFEKLPFALNKGEGILVEIKDLPANLVFKRGMSLVPYRDDIFWLGSSYEWEFADDQPSENFRKNAEGWLSHFLKLPYRILEHFAAIRPATLERRPFVGFHPLNPQIGILNGLGTKGCSLAPYFANQLVENIKGGREIDPLANISRFENLLRRNGGLRLTDDG